MLKIKSPSEVFVTRLVTGEAVIAKLGEVTDTSVTLINPLVMTARQTPEGKYAIFMSMFAIGVDERGDFKIPTSAILFYPVPATEDVSKHYTSSTSSIIQP